MRSWAFVISGALVYNTFMIDLKPMFLKKVKAILKSNMPEFDVLVYGARAAGVSKTHHYLDLVVMSDKPLSEARLEKLSAAFKASGMPFRVETICWAATGPSYRKEMKKTGVLIHKASKIK